MRQNSNCLWECRASLDLLRQYWRSRQLVFWYCHVEKSLWIIKINIEFFYESNLYIINYQIWLFRVGWIYFLSWKCRCHFNTFKTLLISLPSTFNCIKHWKARSTSVVITFRAVMSWHWTILNFSRALQNEASIDGLTTWIPLHSICFHSTQTSVNIRYDFLISFQSNINSYIKFSVYFNLWDPT